MGAHTANAGNTGYATAVAALRKDFYDVDKDGPVRAAAFYTRDRDASLRIRQDVVTVARMLLGET